METLRSRISAFKSVLITGGLLLIVACSTPRKPFQPGECNEQAGADRGFSEGLNGAEPDSAYAIQCREDLRDAVRQGYGKGYEKGRHEYVKRREELESRWEREQRDGSGLRADTLPSPRPAPTEFRCTIQVDREFFEAKSQNEYESRAKVLDSCEQRFMRVLCERWVRCETQAGVAPKNDRAFYCTLSPFTDQFEAFGSTELEARIAVRDRCKLKHDRMFCKSESADCKATPNS